MQREEFMRTTLDLPEDLIEEAMAITHISTKTDLIKTALQSLIQKEKSKSIKQYFGKVDLDIDLNVLRNR
jgi:Arc/MetJ family transcription regulator